MVDKSFVLHALPGTVPGSFGYSSEGHIWVDGAKESRQEAFKKGSVVGCGICFSSSKLFFTLNGKLIKTVDGIEGKLYPSVGLHSIGESVRINFGESPFKFDLAPMIKEVHDAQNAKIEAHQLPSIARLVYNYLIFHGYIDTAVEFAKVAEDIEPYTDRDTVLLGTLETRSTIRQLIMNGDVNTAIELLSNQYPTIFDSSPALAFGLNTQIFIEMIRTRRLDDAMNFAQNEFRNYWNPENQDKIQECCALLCYATPEESPMAYLLTKSHSEQIADQANLAILQRHDQDLEDMIKSSDIASLLNHLLTVQRGLREYRDHGEVFSISQFILNS